MAIAQRLKKRMPEPEYREGYPDLLFEGFRLRFGHINACFTNAKMQSIAGLADPAIQHMKAAPAGAWLFYRKDVLEADIAKRKSNGLSWQFLQDIVDKWPTGEIPSGVRNRIGDE